MTPVIVLILVVLWVVVLTPVLLQKWSERGPSESIDSFHHELHLLERTGPKLVRPAYRLETARSGTGMAVGESGFPAVSSMPGRPTLTLIGREPAGGPLAGPGGGTPGEPAGVAGLGSTANGEGFDGVIARRRLGPDPYRRKQACKRRRDVLGVLAATVLGTGVLGIAHSLRMLWVITAIAAVALVGYVALVVYAQSLVAGRGRVAGPGRPQWRGPGPAGYRAGAAGASGVAGGPYGPDGRGLDPDDGEYAGLRRLAAAR